MTDEEFEGYLQGFSDDQVDALRQLRLLITKIATDCGESINRGRWLNGFIFSAAGQMVYAMGPRGNGQNDAAHMMPFYGSPVLQERHREALSDLLTGKSCIAFRVTQSCRSMQSPTSCERGTGHDQDA